MKTMLFTGAVIVFAAVVLLCGTGCSNSVKPAVAMPARDPHLVIDSRLIDATNDFAFRTYGQLATTDASKNLFISPTSLELALAMTYNGAKSTTQTAMAQTLGVQAMTLDEVNAANAQLLTLLQNPDSKVQLKIADALWGQQGLTFDAGFLQRNTQFYQADVRTIDFTQPSSADTINAWVNQKTAGMIPTLVDYPTIQSAYMLLANALYFKGEWTTPFDPKTTQNGPFTQLSGAQSTLPMMNRTAKDFRYLETNQFQAIALPYGNQYLSMYLFLPKAGTALSDFTPTLTRQNWNQWMTQFTAQPGTLLLPRFSANYASSLKPALQAMGMGVAFSDNADFTGMLPQGGACITDVVHKTAVQVNEQGTTAAAATGVVVGPTAMPQPTQSFTMTVDHPFFMAIRDDPTGAILFMGSIVDPQKM